MALRRREVDAATISRTTGTADPAGVSCTTIAGRTTGAARTAGAPGAARDVGTALTAPAGIAAQAARTGEVEVAGTAGTADAADGGIGGDRGTIIDDDPPVDVQPTARTDTPWAGRSRQGRGPAVAAVAA